MILQVYIPTYVATMYTAAVLHRTAFYLRKVQRPLLDLRQPIFWRNVFQATNVCGPKGIDGSTAL